MNIISLLSICFVAIMLISCGLNHQVKISTGHIKISKKSSEAIPRILPLSQLLPVPEKQKKAETYTLIVSNVPVRELIFSLARNAKIDFDLHDDIKGRVSIHAVNQTLVQILERISQQVAIRYEIKDSHLEVRADKPFFKTYQIDYVNMERKSSGIVRVATTLGSTGANNIGNNARGSAGQKSVGSSRLDNSSLTSIVNESSNQFWKTLEQNIIKLIAENQLQSSTENIRNPNVIVNKEAAVMVIKATLRQHKEIQLFISRLINNAKRQVLIEATIAEIKLDNRYQSGVDWSLLSQSSTSGIDIKSNFRGVNLAQTPYTSLALNSKNNGNNLMLTLRALEEFGDVKVLSSPKVMAINNQPAILKVVDNFVYFELDIDNSINANVSVTSFSTEIKSVPVGFVMSVTPYINEDNIVTLNIRPTISRIIDTVEDPNPEFKRANISSKVPVIQVREIESILQINSGDTAIIGGLMQDTINKKTSGIPFLSSIPLLGNLFSYQNEIHEKSELIIFIRPVVVEYASLDNDLFKFKQYIPEHF